VQDQRELAQLLQASELSQQAMPASVHTWIGPSHLLASQEARQRFTPSPLSPGGALDGLDRPRASLSLSARLH
jgi:hypothetical protein